MAGAFKISSLRNVELTGPYLHNATANNFYSPGGIATSVPRSRGFLAG